ncbi:MAG: hypothetical protein KA207_17790 [Burkholderiaceae bacterium]|nr:hypothetical protein [Burkholderiaceae bacterium]
MVQMPSFIAPARYRDPAAALAQVQQIYHTQIEHLRAAMHAFVAEPDGTPIPPGYKVRACYPFVRIQTDTVARYENMESVLKSKGFVAGPGR